MSDSGGASSWVLFQRRLRVFPDELCQFTVSDGEGFTCEPSRQWIEDLMPPRMLAATDGVLAVGTISCMDVPVTIQWWNQDPGDDYAQWDQVIDAAIAVRTRRLVVMGSTEYPPRARKLPIRPDTYRVRVYSGGMATLADNGLDGEDYYRVALWSGEWCPVTVLEQYPWRQGC